MTPEQTQKREASFFSRKIQTTFKNAGFQYLSTRNIERNFGLKTGELDAVFLYENLLLVCEDTIIQKPGDIKDHLKNKKLLFDEIKNNKDELIDWLKTLRPEMFEKFDEYTNDRYQVFFLYFTKNKLNLNLPDKELLSPIIVVENSTLNYFQKMAGSIKFSARTDIFRFLEIRSRDIGFPNSGDDLKEVSTAIIYPKDNTGFSDDVRIVSFMLSAEFLLDTCFVLRKDNWEDSIELYQRLIEKPRIQSIRKHLALKKTSFINNIIVSLPDDIKFFNEEKKIIELTDIQNFTNCTMNIPHEFNSICVIDGQHRIFAHYEGEDSYEKIIKGLRQKFHLLVTGLIFPESMSGLDRRKFEGEIFQEINSNAKPVPPDVLLFIEALKDPFSDQAVARQALVSLNKQGVFQNLFRLSLTEESRIKVASIIKFALRYLVEINEDEDRETLYKYWEPEQKKLLAEKNDTKILQDYISFVVNLLNAYFGALREVYKADWESSTSKILSTTSINGFLIALRLSLQTIGIQDFSFYREAFLKLHTDFSKEGFDFTASQYHKFSRVILEECFGITK